MDALVRVASIADAVDRLDGRVQRGVEADGELGIIQVVINRAGNADRRHAQIVERARAGIGSVSADAHKTLNAQRAKVAHGFLLHGFLEEIQAAGGHQHRAALVDDAGHAAGIHFNVIVLGSQGLHQQAVIAALKTNHGHLIAQRRANDSANRGIHAGRVATGSQYADALHGWILLLCLHPSPGAEIRFAGREFSQLCLYYNR